jgi:hypothetical protein
MRSSFMAAALPTRLQVGLQVLGNFVQQPLNQCDAVHARRSLSLIVMLAGWQRTSGEAISLLHTFAMCKCACISGKNWLAPCRAEAKLTLGYYSIETGYLPMDMVEIRSFPTGDHELLPVTIYLAFCAWIW